MPLIRRQKLGRWRSSSGWMPAGYRRRIFRSKPCGPVSLHKDSSSSTNSFVTLGQRALQYSRKKSCRRSVASTTTCVPAQVTPSRAAFCSKSTALRPPLSATVRRRPDLTHANRKDRDYCWLVSSIQCRHPQRVSELQSTNHRWPTAHRSDRRTDAQRGHPAGRQEPAHAHSTREDRNAPGIASVVDAG